MTLTCPARPPACITCRPTPPRPASAPQHVAPQRLGIRGVCDDGGDAVEAQQAPRLQLRPGLAAVRAQAGARGAARFALVNTAGAVPLLPKRHFAPNYPAAALLFRHPVATHVALWVVQAAVALWVVGPPLAHTELRAAAGSAAADGAVAPSASQTAGVEAPAEGCDVGGAAAQQAVQAATAAGAVVAIDGQRCPAHSPCRR